MNMHTTSMQKPEAPRVAPTRYLRQATVPISRQARRVRQLCFAAETLFSKTNSRRIVAYSKVARPHRTLDFCQCDTCILLLSSQALKRVAVLLNIMAKIVPLACASSHSGKLPLVGRILIIVFYFFRSRSVHLVCTWI